MPVRTPTTQQFVEIASSFRLALTEDEAASFRRGMHDILGGHRWRWK